MCVGILCYQNQYCCLFWGSQIPCNPNWGCWLWGLQHGSKIPHLQNASPCSPSQSCSAGGRFISDCPTASTEAIWARDISQVTIQQCKEYRIFMQIWTIFSNSYSAPAAPAGPDHVDYGAYTGGYGAFGWYTDHPVLLAGHWVQLCLKLFKI